MTDEAKQIEAMARAMYEALPNRTLRWESLSAGEAAEFIRDARTALSALSGLSPRQDAGERCPKCALPKYERSVLFCDHAFHSLSPPKEAAQDMVTVPRALIQEAIDLLAERRYGNPARSPGHNARLALESALAASPSAVDVPREGDRT